MKRKAKFLGVAFAAALALSVAAASAASAEDFIFTSEVEPTTLTGQQLGSSTMTFDAGSAKCEEGSYSGSMAQKGAVELSMSASFKGCSFPFGAVEVAMNSCRFVFIPGSVEGSSFTGETNVYCEKEGDKVVATAKLGGVTKCTIEIKPQTNRTAVSYENTGSPTAVKAKLSLTGLEYDQTPGTGLFACAKAEGKSNGKFEGTVEIKGFGGGMQKKFESEPLPLTAKFVKPPLQLAGAKSSLKFEVENAVNESITISGFFSNAVAVNFAGTCGVLAKMGDKCTETVQCLNPTKADIPIAVFTVPFGGSKTLIKGC